MLKRILVVAAGLLGLTVGALGVLVWGSQAYWYPERPNIPFAPLQNTALKDPDNPIKMFRIDMAPVEQEYPLTRAHLASVNPEHIRALSQEELDQLYGRLAAGPIPDGPFMGDFVFPRADDTSDRQEAWKRFKHLVPFVDADPPPRLAEALGGVEGRVAGESIKMLEKIGRAVWKGMIFYRDQMVLRNFTENTIVDAIIRADDRKAVEKTKVPREGWLRFFSPMTTVNLLFPAKLHCGQSLLDGRRESIIIDYAFNDEVPGYQRNPDGLVGRNGLRVRDELRMIRPGFYLGRAYVNRILVVNFTLYNPAVAEAGLDGFTKGAPITEDCWLGEQLRHAAKN
jgi:hypothetical protein